MLLNLRYFLLISTCLPFSYFSFASNSDDEVSNLPGLPKIAFKHYSGYLNASRTHFLHYWFVESQNSPSNDPVVLWMNGGPGCSSLDGFLSELGPFLVNDNGATLSPNPYAWNKKANVIFLEAPAGVGFSFSSDGQIATNDDQTSLENYMALKSFFAKYPEFRKNDFYITGESYGGIYVPTLAVRVAEGVKDYPINFKGIAVGNGMLDFDLNTNTLIEFAYNHGLVDEKAWNVLEQKCCKGCSDTCDFNVPEAGFCNETVSKILYTVYEMGLNVYDLYRDCYHGQQVYERYFFDIKHSFPKYSHLLKKVAADESIESSANVGSPPCLNDTAIRMYLNRADVKKALHIADNLPAWTICSESVERSYLNVYKHMYQQFKTLIKFGARIMVYNGDTDMACNFLMNQKFVSNLNLTAESSKKAWLVEGQIAGFVTSFKELDFVTVKGAGHMVPQWRPVQAYHMIKSFLENVPL